MANIGTFTIPGTEWVNLEEVIREKVSDFGFVVDTNYLIQNRNSYDFEIVEQDEIPSGSQGFIVRGFEKLGYTHRGTTVYVKGIGRCTKLELNIST